MDAPKTIGRYEILEVLGQGAMGTVYRAKDPAMSRIVALKTIISVVLASEQGAEFRERFYREARVAGALSHPGIVAVFDVGEHEGMPFLVMEFISGRTLTDAVEKGERFSPDRVCEVGQKLAEALGYAHQHGVIHRDIKPPNILLTSLETHGIERPKITDFGVAKLAEGHTTLTGQIRGTPAFMSPEQFTGAPVDGRSDIFSLGVVLYWMAAGEQPFPGKSMTSVFYKIVHTEPVPPRRVNTAVPSKLDSIIMKCLAKDPAERYQTGEELARALGEARGTLGTTGTATSFTRAPTPGSEFDATIVEVPPPAAASPAPVLTRDATKPPSPNNTDRRWIAAAAVAALIVASTGGWYILRSRGKSEARETEAQPAATTPAAPLMAGAPATPAVANAPATESATQPVAKPDLKPTAKEVSAPAPPPGSAKPVGAPKAATAPGGATKNPAANASTKAAPKPPIKVEGAIPPPSPALPPVAVEFNPKTLDPKQNARLKIDAEKTPSGLAFVVEMNGKRYLQWSGTGSKQEDDLLVPPGVQEFRVVARSGAVEKTSNIVSAEFKAKKRNTLRIELRAQGIPQGIPQGLYPDTQLVISLK